MTRDDGFGPFDPYWTDDVPPPRFLSRGWRGRVSLGLAAAAGLVAASLCGSPRPLAPPAQVSVTLSAPTSEKVQPALAPLFALDGADAASGQYEARVTAGAGDRRDLLSVGALDGEGPSLRLEMWKRGQARPATSLFVEIAEQAAAFASAVGRLEVSQTLASSQGPVEWAELSLAGAPRSCAGFRLVGRDTSGLRGIVCAAKGGRIDAGAISCLLDRVTLTPAGRDAGLGALIRGSVGRRQLCRQPID